LFVFPYSSNGVLAFYAIQQVAQGLVPVLFRGCSITAFFYHVSVYIYYIFILCGLHFNHLFIWLILKLAHDALIATKVGYLNFPFGLLEQYFGWMEFIDITLQKKL
jgi:hypothetical protein